MLQNSIENKTDDAASLIARNAAKLTYEDLPPGVVEITKKGILDAIGVILPASSTSSDAKKLFDIIRDLGGKKDYETPLIAGRGEIHDNRV
jgi:2-methylcitrate dehydratase PrpD